MDGGMSEWKGRQNENADGRDGAEEVAVAPGDSTKVGRSVEREFSGSGAVPDAATAAGRVGAGATSGLVSLRGGDTVDEREAGGGITPVASPGGTAHMLSAMCSFC